MIQNEDYHARVEKLSTNILDVMLMGEPLSVAIGIGTRILMKVLIAIPIKERIHLIDKIIIPTLNRLKEPE